MIEHLTKSVPSIIEQYHKRHDIRNVPVLIDLLKPMIEERGFADRIIWERYDFPAKNIAAQVSFYQRSLGLYAGVGDYARIQYSNSLNLCWSRFAICKEMFHCILDNDPKYRITNMGDLFKLSENLVTDMTSRIMSEFAPHRTEQDAEILALETLFPLELRQSYRSAYDAGQITDYQLALRFRIPQEFARVGMYPNYIGRIAELRSETLIDIND